MPFINAPFDFGRDLKWNPHIHALISEGFYVRAKPNDCTLAQTIKYITRYLGRPVIAASRIDHYDGDNVTFHYNRHEDDTLVTESIPALDFIKKLIIHIPEKHFKMVRYYGIYAKHHKQEKQLFKYLSNEKRKFLESLLDWRNSILLTLDYDPLKCSKCGASMLVLEVYHKKLHYLNNIESKWDLDSSNHHTTFQIVK